MIDVFLLGTSGTVPLPNRFLTSCYLRCKGCCILIDCGEATQIALNSQKLSFKQIDTILLTHLHADHTSGLPGLLLTMGKTEREKPIRIIGPKGTAKMLQGVMTIAMYVPFQIECIELSEDIEEFSIGDFDIQAFHLQHRIACYGYSFRVKRNPEFLPEKAKERNIPIEYWSKLQKGIRVETEDGTIFEPSFVLGEERKGLHVVYATDTRPTEILCQMSKDADLLIAEGMYGDPLKQENAIENKHMMMQESASIAKNANVKELWFTHYSTSVVNPNIYREEIEKIFPNVIMSKDGQHKTLVFETNEETSYEDVK